MSAKFIFGSSAAYLAITIAERIASLITFPLMTRVLSPSDYGVMLLVGNCAAAVNLLFGFSLGQALPTLFSNSPSKERQRSTSTTIVLSVVTILCALYLTIAIFSPQISLFFLHTSAYARAITLGAASSFVGACAISLVALVRLTERHNLYLFVQLPALALQLSLLVALFFTASLSVETQYLATACAGIFSTIVYGISLKNWLSGKFETKILIDAGRIGLQVLPWQMANLLATNSAAFFLTRSGHIEEAGFFLVASGASGLILAASYSFANVWTPFVLLRKDQPAIAQTQIRIFSLYSSALMIAASALSLFSHEIFMVLAGPKFREGYHYVPALTLAYCIFCFADCFAQGLQARKKTIHYAWIGAIASIVFLVTALTVTEKLGAWGIILAMGASFLAMLTMLQVTSAQFMPVAYPWREHGLMWLMGIGIVAYVYPVAVGWSGAIAKLAALTGIASLPLVFGALHITDVLLVKAWLSPAKAHYDK